MLDYTACPRARAPALTRVWCACARLFITLCPCVLALFSKRPNTCAFEALRIRGARGRTRPRNCQAHRIACRIAVPGVCRRTSCNPNRDRPICHTRKRALAHSDSNSLTPERARARVHAIEMQMVPLLVVADSRKHTHTHMCSRMCVRTHFVYVVPSQFAYMASHCMYQLYMFFLCMCVCVVLLNCCLLCPSLYLCVAAFSVPSPRGVCVCVKIRI